VVNAADWCSTVDLCGKSAIASAISMVTMDHVNGRTMETHSGFWAAWRGGNVKKLLLLPIAAVTNAASCASIYIRHETE
jgi:hypothetical protein